MASIQPQEIRTVAIIGCGVIGASWACLFLSRGLKVIITDPAEGTEETFKKYLQDVWPTLQENDALQHTLPESYEFVSDIKTRLLEVDFVQENGPESVDYKQKLMETLDQHTRPDVVIASSSSGLPSSTFIQRCHRDPGRILVGHPFNPPHLIPLVEVVPHPRTHASSIDNAMELYRTLGKKPILLRHEVPGFVCNRLQAAINNEAYSLISRGVVSAEDLDMAVTGGPGLRWALTGPIVTNALGGGGGPNGFMQRIERLGPGIRNWEEDILKHRFDWSAESLAALENGTGKWLQTVDLIAMKEERDRLLSELLKIKSRKPSSI